MTKQKKGANARKSANRGQQLIPVLHTAAIPESGKETFGATVKAALKESSEHVVLHAIAAVTTTLVFIIIAAVTWFGSAVVASFGFTGVPLLLLTGTKYIALFIEVRAYLKALRDNLAKQH